MGSMQPTTAELIRELLCNPVHDRELDEMIAAGWGDVDQDKIPANWRTRRGPDPQHSAEWRAKISNSLKASLAGRDQAA